MPFAVVSTVREDALHEGFPALSRGWPNRSHDGEAALKAGIWS
jgi:hypothetical protein